MSQGKTEQEALDNIQEAIQLCLEVRREQGLPLTIESRQVEVPVYAWAAGHLRPGGRAGLRESRLDGRSPARQPRRADQTRLDLRPLDSPP
jgi:hypothetical protein